MESPLPMKKADSNNDAISPRTVTCKHFPITEADSYVEYSIKMSELQYQNLTEGVVDEIDA